jgi:hypothetical protein
VADLTETQKRAIAVLDRGDTTASNLGLTLWGNGTRKPQSYALPAGRLLKQLKVRGLVECYPTPTHTMWKLTRKAKT